MSRSSDSNDLLRLEGVSVRFDALQALHPLSLSIGEGERVALVGPSGAGKTTLLRILNATLRPTTGEVHLDGKRARDYTPAQLRQWRSRIGFVYQDLSLVPNLRVIQNVLSGRLGQQGVLRSAKSLFFPTRAEVTAVHEILERVGIGEKLYERTDRLSGGQQQRVAIARALYQDPILLLADEPVASVDPARARRVVKLLTEISAERNLSLVMSLHNLELAREFFPRLVGLRGGEVAFDRAADELTGHEFEKLYEIPGDSPTGAES